MGPHCHHGDDYRVPEFRIIPHTAGFWLRIRLFQKIKIPKILYQKVIEIRLQCLCYSDDIALVLNNY